MRRLVTLSAFVLACNGGGGGCNGDKDDNNTPTTGDTGPEVTFAVLGDAENLPPAALKAIWGTASDDVWMVGADDGTGPLLLHWDGAAWSRIDTSAHPGGLWWIWSDGGDTIWLSGEGARVLTYSRSSGTITGETVISSIPTYTLFGLWGTGPDDIWSVGGDVSNAVPGAIFHFDGTDWSEPGGAPPTDLAVNVPNNPTGDSPRQAFKVWGAATDDVWVVGTGALVMHWDGAAWSDAGQPVYNTSVLTTVHGTGPDEVVAVGGPGNARIAYYDGTTWTEDSPPPADIVPPLNGVFGSAEHGIVACGDYGAVYWRVGPTDWEADPRPSATARSFHACWLDQTGAVWAVGGDLTNQDEGVIIYGGDEAIPPVAL